MLDQPIYLAMIDFLELSIKEDTVPAKITMENVITAIIPILKKYDNFWENKHEINRKSIEFQKIYRSSYNLYLRFQR